MVSLTEASIVSLLTFLIGLFVGHRFALYRDKRKEFNDASVPIRAWALKLNGPNHAPPSKPSENEIDLFRQHLSNGNKRAFNSLLHHFDSLVSQESRRDETNSEYFGDLSGLGKIGFDLLRLTARK